MIIDKIIITNFGVYGGTNEFDFTTSPEKTVVLCGGTNGAGKTTLFESIMLCFYGKDYDDTDSVHYNQKILRSFHKNLRTNSVSTDSSISIVFQIAFDGKVQRYRITRTWKNDDGKVNEDLSVQKHDSQLERFRELDMSIPAKRNRHTDAKFEEIDSVEKSEWQQFINQLIPRGIAKLFFFDGEKIQDIAENDDESRYIQSSFDTLLGLDLVNQLQKDIGFVLYRETKKKSASEKRVATNHDTMTPEKLKREMLKKELVEFAELRNNYEQHRKTYDKPMHLENFEYLLRFVTNDMREKEFAGDQLQSLLFIQEILEEKIQRMDIELQEISEQAKSSHKEFLLATERFQKIGGDYYEKDKNLEESQEDITSKIAVTEKEIRDLCSAELPFSLIPEQLREIKEQIESDKDTIRLNYEKEILEKNTKKISRALDSKSFLPDIPTDTKQMISAELSKLLSEDLEGKPMQDIFFSLSPADTERFLRIIVDSQGATIERIEGLTVSYGIQRRALEKFSVIGKIKPEIDEIKSIMSERDLLRDKERELENQCDRIESDLSQAKTRLKMLNSKIRISLERQTSSEKLSSSESVASSVLNVLEAYSDSLRAEKISFLENNILRGLDILLHKKDFIKNIIIDKETFVVKLCDKHGNEITKNMMSKGEIQIYAIALVWGLAKTSGRPLPFMIDTPLARLDVEHRESLVESFFPRTSQQTIILSTDSEIIPAYYKKLEQYISRTYTMEFDSDKGATNIRRDCFFDDKMEIKVEVH